MWIDFPLWQFLYTVRKFDLTSEFAIQNEKEHLSSGTCKSDLWVMFTALRWVHAHIQ